MFDDDWEASTFLYPRHSAGCRARPPITLLVVAIGNNIIFDPAKEELAVAETGLAVSVSAVRTEKATDKATSKSDHELRLLSIRTVDPPSRLTPPGIPNSQNTTTANHTGGQSVPKQGHDQALAVDGVWKAPLGGTKYEVMDRIINTVLTKGGVIEEVLVGLEGVELA